MVPTHVNLRGAPKAVAIVHPPQPFFSPVRFELEKLDGTLDIASLAVYRQAQHLVGNHARVDGHLDDRLYMVMRHSIVRPDN